MEDNGIQRNKKEVRDSKKFKKVQEVTHTHTHTHTHLYTRTLVCVALAIMFVVKMRKKTKEIKIRRTRKKFWMMRKKIKKMKQIEKDGKEKRMKK